MLIQGAEKLWPKILPIGDAVAQMMSQIYAKDHSITVLSTYTDNG